MYDELVRKLRSHNGWALNETLDQAAAAIEELQAAVEREKAFADFWEEMAQECKARFEKLLSAYREKHADNCPHYIHNVHDRGDDSLCDVLRNTMSWCVGNEPCEGRTPSNADSIRAMSDEELAEWLFLAWHKSWYTLQEWLDWLKQEAE